MRIRLPTYSLRLALLLIAASGMILGYWARSAHRQKDAVEHFRAIAGEFVCGYDNHPSDTGHFRALKDWIARWLGEDFAFNVISVRIEGAAIDDESCARLVDCPRLEFLCLNGPLITDRGLASVGRLCNLDEIAICQCAITDAGLADLSSLRKLNSLWLWSTKIKGDGFQHLEACERLSKLRIEGDALTPTGFMQLARLRNLRDVWLSIDGVDDTAMKQLRSLAELEELRSEGNSLTDACVDDILALRRLKSLHLGWPQMSPESLRRLRARIPEVVVESDYPWTRPYPGKPRPFAENDTAPDLLDPAKFEKDVFVPAPF